MGFRGPPEEATMAGQPFQEHLKGSYIQDLLCRGEAPDLGHKHVPYLCSKFGALNPKNKENRSPENLWDAVGL